MNFTDKKVSVKQAIAILAKSGIEIDDNEAMVAIEFLYLMAKNQNSEDKETVPKPRGESEL